MSKLHAQERRERILTLLRQRGFMKTQALIEALGASGATVRRDLEALERAGQLQRVHGGVSLPTRDIRYLTRQGEDAAAKASMARAALGLIQPGQTVYLDAGTTASALALALRRAPTLTGTLRVVTHGIDVAYLLNGECSLHVVGGEVYGSTYSLTGPDTVAAAQRYRYDLFFVGCTSIDPQYGPTNSNLTEAHQKAAVMGRAEKSVLLAAGRKWGAGDFAPFAAFSQLSAWVTDAAPPAARAAFGEIVQIIEAGALGSGRSTAQPAGT